MSRQAAHAKAKSPLRCAPSPRFASLSHSSDRVEKERSKRRSLEQERNRDVFFLRSIWDSTLHPLTRLSLRCEGSCPLTPLSLSFPLPRRRDFPDAFTFTTRHERMCYEAPLN